MLLALFFLLPGRFSSVELRERTALQNSVATLPCAHQTGDVAWSRFVNGEPVTLVTIQNGVEKRKMSDGRFGSLADNSLVIRNVTPFDATMYLCNNSKVYLSVTTDTKMAAPAKRPRNGPRPGREGTAEDAENPPASGLWEVPVGVAVGVVGGAALTLLVVLTVKFCFKNRAEKTAILDPTGPEATYEEIQGAEPYFENPYDFPSVGETTRSSTAAYNMCIITPNNNLNNNLYSTGDNLSEQCVYSLAQNPVKTGHERE
ncbi:uncharacterized protein LOC130189939 [Pseudoliparis swirei]|uniref:uncharacterized protein LOC130189939 n=1 Tax=Pseudoliparis swirei TaxID=2059687 RepID=UPI0024BEF24F|nr:uncharacterized protein LOC130189939 [Pseudoliparis swirei]